MHENPYPVEIPPLLAKKIPLLKRIVAKYITPVHVYTDTVHFKAPTKIYLAYCPVHKTYYYDYLHGYSNYLICPRCFREIVNEDIYSSQLSVFKCPSCGGQIVLSWKQGEKPTCLKCGRKWSMWKDLVTQVVGEEHERE